MRLRSSRPVFAVLLAAAGTLALAAPAFALPDRIAYRCDLDICLVDPSAPGAATNLTDNGATSAEGSPVWSPDGTKLAFRSTFGNGPATGFNLFVMNPEAVGNLANLATKLTFFSDDGGLLTDPVWSPDGTQVAFERKASYLGVVGVYVVRSDGTSVQPVTVTTDGQHPTWSPDGTRIAFSRGEQVYIAPSAGGTAVPLTAGSGHDPVWSPDGTRIAFDKPQAPPNALFVDLDVVRVDGTGSPVITPIGFSQWTFATWSPDGARIAYRSTVSNDGYLRVVAGDGTQDVGLAGSIGLNVYGTAPTWSPDGARIAFYGYRYSPAPATNDIYLASTTNGAGAPQPITTDGKSFEPAWRPQAAPASPAGGGSPAPGAPAAAPGPARKPTVVWITRRIPFTPGLPTPIRIAVYSCGGPACSVGVQGTSGVAPPRTASAGTAARKRRTIVVGSSRMVVPANSSRPLTLKLSRAGRALLLKRRALTITVTVTTTGPQRPRVVQRHTVRVYVKRARPRR